MEKIATLCLVCALLHSFSVPWIQRLALRFEPGSVQENLFHLLGEIEVVFGLWAGIFLAWSAFFEGSTDTLSYLNQRNFTEPAFVFVIMVVASTKPILVLAHQLLSKLAHLLPLKGSLPFYCTTLIIGPLLGSFITEPAAMTITAILLAKKIYAWPSLSPKLKYATLGLLFVNVSIGGTLTPYAAPPVLMVSHVWNWDLDFMLFNFGWKALAAIIISTSFVAFRFRKELGQLTVGEQFSSSPLSSSPQNIKNQDQVPLWMSLAHLFFLGVIVLSSHHQVLFILFFLFFLGFTSVTQEYQEDLKIREGLLVSFFLGGVVILGGMQSWWLEPLLKHFESTQLYLGAIGLTAITDNAALTYLGAQVPSLSEFSRYALVAGSVVGGGLTIIANAPNPAGYGILNHFFGPEGVHPLRLFSAALLPTLIAALCFWP